MWWCFKLKSDAFQRDLDVILATFLLGPLQGAAEDLLGGHNPAACRRVGQLLQQTKLGPFRKRKQLSEAAGSCLQQTRLGVPYLGIGCHFCFVELSVTIRLFGPCRDWDMGRSTIFSASSTDGRWKLHNEMRTCNHEHLWGKEHLQTWTLLTLSGKSNTAMEKFPSTDDSPIEMPIDKGFPSHVWLPAPAQPPIGTTKIIRSALPSAVPDFTRQDLQKSFAMDLQLRSYKLLSHVEPRLWVHL